MCDRAHNKRSDRSRRIECLLNVNAPVTTRVVFFDYTEAVIASKISKFPIARSSILL